MLFRKLTSQEQVQRGGPRRTGAFISPAHGNRCNRGGRGRTLQKGVLGRLAGGVSVGAPHLQAHKLSAYDTQPLVGSACLGKRLQEAGGLVSSRQARELMRTLVDKRCQEEIPGEWGRRKRLDTLLPSSGAPACTLPHSFTARLNPALRTVQVFAKKFTVSLFKCCLFFFFF